MRDAGRWIPEWQRAGGQHEPHPAARRLASGKGRGWKVGLSQTRLIYWTRVMSCSQVTEGQKLKSRCHSLGSFLWKSVVPRRLVLAKHPSPQPHGQEGAVDTKSCQSRETFPYAKPGRQQNSHFQRARQKIQCWQLLVRFWCTFCQS